MTFPATHVEHTCVAEREPAAANSRRLVPGGAGAHQALRGAEENVQPLQTRRDSRRDGTYGVIEQWTVLDAAATASLRETSGVMNRIDSKVRESVMLVRIQLTPRITARIAMP